MKKFLSITLVLVLIVGCFAACGNKNEAPPADENTPADVAPAEGTAFKLGGIGPLTGEAAIYGTAAMNGAQIAVDEINALGGAIQFEFKAEDDVADGETSVNAYNSLLDWGMQVLVGPVTTGAAISVSAEAFNERV